MHYGCYRTESYRDENEELKKVGGTGSVGWVVWVGFKPGLSPSHNLKV